MMIGVWRTWSFLGLATVGWVASSSWTMAVGAAEQSTGSEASQATQPKTVVLDASAVWVVSPDEPEPVRRALRDVQNDWYKVLGRLPTIVDKMPEKWDRPIVLFGTQASWLKRLTQATFSGPESFLVEVRHVGGNAPAVLAAGADMRGAIYAAFTLSKEFLGVDPLYFWVDKEPRYRGRVEIPADYRRTWGPPTFKYRGWFINDEDLMAWFAPDPLGEGVFSLEMWDRIYEALLRVGGNTVIPGTFTFPDERMQVLASKRGLIGSQHHICVVGLNTFRWPEGLPYSYSSHPEILEAMWQKCVNAMKDRETVWTLGLRGRHDHPFWNDDKEAATPEIRGRLISKAIATQAAMVRAVQPNADCIAYLWSEGVELFRAGHLRLPKGVIPVWPDDGAGRLLDGGKAEAGHGVYYHTAMLSNHQSQLSELVSPARIHHELTRMVRSKATSYLMVNTSDFRPVPMTTSYVMELAWNASDALGKGSSQAMQDYLRQWSGRQFSAELADAIAGVYSEYFSIPYIDAGLGDNHLTTEINGLLGGIQWTAGADRGTAPTQAAEQTAKRYAAASRQLAELAARADALAPRVPADRRDFYHAHVVAQVAIHRRLCAVIEATCRSVAALGKGDKPAAVAGLDDALGEYGNLFECLRRAEYGRWRGWYAGEKFCYLFDTEVRLKRLRALLKGEPLPAARYGGPYDYPDYPEVYRYQGRAKANYPLFYRARRGQ